MPLKLYLDKRQNKHGESPIRVVWSFNGDRYQTTLGFSIPANAWDDAEKRVTPAEYNHKKNGKKGAPADKPATPPETVIE